MESLIFLSKQGEQKNIGGVALSTGGTEGGGKEVAERGKRLHSEHEQRRHEHGREVP